MSFPNDYTKTLHDITIKQVVADLVNEKVGIGTMSASARQDLYKVKLMSLTALGLSISYNTLAQKEKL